MFSNKTALFILILCSFSLFLAEAYNPTLQKGYFYVAPYSPFSYEFPQTRNGTIAHYYQRFGQSISGSRFMLFDPISGDAYEIFLKTALACQIITTAGTPVFQPIHYHIQTDNLVYFCTANTSLLFINQADQTVQSAIPFNLTGTVNHAKLSTDGMSVDILVVDTLFNANPQSSVLFKVDMQSKQVTSQIVFNQNLTTGEAVVAYTIGNKASYIATNIWQNNNLTTTIYSIIILGNTYQIAPVVNFTSSNTTITKLFAIGNYIIVNIDTTLYFLNNLGMMVQLAHIRTKALTDGIFHPAVVLSNDGSSLYLHTDTLEVEKYTIIASGIFTKNLGISQDMQILQANQTSNDLMFTYDPSGLFFNTVDLQTGKTIRTAISGFANDFMLTDTTYTVVQNNTFYILDLKTDSLLFTVNIPSSKYYYSKDQSIVTFLSTSCQVSHLDLVSGKLWTTLNLSSSDACSSYIFYARVTDKGNPELVIPGNQSYLIVSETYGQLTFNTNYTAHDNDIINVNFDDLSFYFYHADQTAIQVNASFYTFDSQSQSFQLNDTHTNKREADKNHLFVINQNVTLALCQLTLTLINQLNTSWFNINTNNFNLAAGFEDQNGDLFLVFSYRSTDGMYPYYTTPLILNSSGASVSAPIRDNTLYGQVTGPRSFALYDKYSSNIGVVRFYNSDLQDSTTLISM